jgi:hypothetical protein
MEVSIIEEMVQTLIINMSIWPFVAMIEKVEGL